MHITAQSNLSDLFLERVRETPEAPAYCQFDGQRWNGFTWAETAREVGRWQAALAREGLAVGDRVALCLRNRREWVLFDQAALGLGLVTVPLYFDDRADNMAWCMNDAGARLLLLEDAAQWSALKGHLKHVQRVVCLGGEVGEHGELVSLADWLPATAGAPVRSPARASDLASIVYTSGTTGRPKGVMLSHRNFLSNVETALRVVPVARQDRLLSFLPLSHVFERTCGYYAAMWAGAETVYARGITALAEDLQTHRPTVLVTVPRIFERVWSRMQEQMPPGSPKRKLFDKAVHVGWRCFKGEATPGEKILWPLLRRLVAKKLYRRLGGRLHLIPTGGAPLAPELARIFVGLGLPILQGYGLTETAPMLSGNRFDDNDPLSVGKAFDGIELKLSESGELLARGPNVMLGYWNNPAATAAAIDEDGWFHTGDVARIDNGRVYITGRIKEIIVLSNGEKVPPADAEAAILRDPVFEQVMVVGEARARLGLLCVARTDDLRDLCERANAQLRDFPGYARICHVARVVEPWTVENGLLTPKLSMKRKQIEHRFAREIEHMYVATDFSQKRRGAMTV
jgi:long-chain acyl-CoA synthetase